MTSRILKRGKFLLRKNQIMVFGPVVEAVRYQGAEMFVCPSKRMECMLLEWCFSMSNCLDVGKLACGPVKAAWNKTLLSTTANVCPLTSHSRLMHRIGTFFAVRSSQEHERTWIYRKFGFFGSVLCMVCSFSTDDCNKKYQSH